MAMNDLIFKKSLIYLLLASLSLGVRIETVYGVEFSENIMDGVVESVIEGVEDGIKKKPSTDKGSGGEEDETESKAHYYVGTVGAGLAAALAYALMTGSLGPLLHDTVDPALTQLPPSYQDVNSSFRIYGRNETQILRDLKMINGIEIVELERLMRPRADDPRGRSSIEGFLGPDESLLAVLATDNDYVLNDLGSTHQELVRPLHTIVEQCRINRYAFKKNCRYQGQLFRIQSEVTKGWQYSPFTDSEGRDQTGGGDMLTVTNLANRARIRFANLLLPMILRYGFYEGLGTNYRLAPQAIRKLFPNG